MASQSNQSSSPVREDTFRGNSAKPLTTNQPKNKGDDTPRPKQ